MSKRKSPERDFQKQVCEFLGITLRVPPSANRMWRTGQGRTYSSPQYELWASAAQWDVKLARGNVTFDVPVQVEIRAQCPHASRDLDNMIKPLLDSLEKGGALKNDNLVKKLSIEWAGRGGLVDVSISPLRAEVV